MCKTLNGIQKTFIIGIVFSLMMICSSTASFAADLKKYKQLAEDTITQAKNGRIRDIDQLIAVQDQLVKIGVNACNEYAAKHPKAKRVLELVTSNANKMKQLSLTEIEEKWHHGGELEKHGYKVKSDHFGQVGNLIDAVIHPATTYIVLNHYKRDKNPAHLDQVVAELVEVLEHLNQLH